MKHVADMLLGIIAMAVAIAAIYAAIAECGYKAAQKRQKNREKPEKGFYKVVLVFGFVLAMVLSAIATNLNGALS